MTHHPQPLVVVVHSTMVSSSPPKIGGLSLSEPDTEVELERFRREWQEEVKGKARKVPPAEITIPPKSKGKDKADSDGVAIAQVQVDEPDLALQLSRTRSGASAATSSKPVPISPKKVLRSPVKSTSRLPEPPLSTSPTKIPFRAPQLRKDRDAAVVIYSRAVEAEQSGRLNDALGLYRTAFKMDDNVDKLYQRLVIKRAETQPEVEEASVVDVVDPTAPDDAPFAFRTHIQVQPDYERAGVVRRTKESRLTTLLSGQEGAEFLPAEEELPVPIASLPAELVEPILAHLDVASIEAFGSTCWRARSLTANAGVWRRIVQYLYRPPMIPRAITAVELSRRHAGEWRTTLIEEERVRMDGCYISVCHYVRPGAGEEWVAVTHMSEYNRRSRTDKYSYVPPLSALLPRRQRHFVPHDRSSPRSRPAPQQEPPREGTPSRSLATGPQR